LSSGVGDHIKGGISFCIAEYGLLRTTTIGEKNHTLCCPLFVCNNNLVIEVIITGLRKPFTSQNAYFLCN